MRGTLKTAALEHYFPLLAVEHDCILSKNAEVTVAYRVVLPELFTLTGAEYEALHGAWLKALRVLPDYTIVHKQDYFTEEHYRPDLASDESFLGRAFERHFNERPFLRHSCYLFITKTSKEQMRRRSDFSSLCRGFIVPQEIRDTESVTLFLDAAEQMRRILCDAGFIRLEPLTADEIVGTADDSGLIARYFALGTEGIVTNEDLRLDDGQIRIGNRSLAMYTLSDLDYVPQAVGTDSRYERFSTDRSDCRLSFAAPAGLLLGHPHIYNQYVFLDNHAETLKSLEARARNMNSLARYSRANSVNKEWIDLYLNEAHTEGYRSVRCHCNVLIWADSETALKGICNDVGSQLALMGCTPHRNTVDVPALFWAGIPGAEGEFPAEESFPTFLEQALCFFAEETAYRSSPSPFGIKLVDRLSGIPLHLDISDEPIKRGITTNRNKFVLGPSGSGKSIIAMNLARQYALAKNVPAYYVQLSPEQTKTSLILGLRLENGSLAVKNGVVADCMERGGIIIVDEATHSVQEILLMFNSILDRTSVTAIGDKMIYAHEDFRIVFCSNDSRYSGNVKLPQSFAQRLVSFYFDYPTAEDEFLIVEQIVAEECRANDVVPVSLKRYIIELMREVRSNTYPLSVRNAAIAVVLCNLELLRRPEWRQTMIDSYFYDNRNVESIKRYLAKRVLGCEAASVTDLTDRRIMELEQALSAIGILTFKEIILQSFMYYLDVDLGFYDLQMVKEKLESSII